MEKILIFASNEAIKESIKLILSDYHNLIICSDFKQCQDILQNSDISIFLIDIDNESNVIATIKDCKLNHPSIKFVTIADHKSEDVAQQTVQNGCNGYIIKPLKSDQLFNICRK